jgi:hypothetical protein
MQVKKALSFQKRKLNIKQQPKADEASTLEAIFKNQGEILSAQKSQRDKLLVNTISRQHQVSHDVPDEENLDESNEVKETENSIKKRKQRVSINLTGQLEASKKLSMGSVQLKPSI